jgi:hypothetical protein
MKVLAPVTTAQSAINILTPLPGHRLRDPETGASCLHWTTTYWGIIEALIRFDNLPSLPLDVIQEADLSSP